MRDPSPVVVQAGDVAPGARSPAPGESIAVTTLDARRGCPNLVQVVVAIGAGGEWRTRVRGGGECWYLGEGTATFEAGGSFQAGAGTGLFVPPGRRCRVANEGPGPVRLFSVVLPGPSAGDEVIVAGLEQCPVERTGDREFRVLLGARRGLGAATQFVGHIPPGRAPEHAHTYDEVVSVLEGSGRVHAGGDVHPLRPGTCVYLPPHVAHCLENASAAPMRVLGVFHPGDSPAAKLTRSQLGQRRREGRTPGR